MASALQVYPEPVEGYTWTPQYLASIKCIYANLSSCKCTTTEDLIVIISNDGDWLPEIITAAKEELVKRNVDMEQLQRTISSNLQHKQKIDTIKANASYSVLQATGIILFAPLLFIWKIISNDVFDLDHDGYIKKSKQRFWLTILGIVLVFISSLFLPPFLNNYT